MLILREFLDNEESGIVAFAQTARANGARNKGRFGAAACRWRARPEIAVAWRSRRYYVLTISLSNKCFVLLEYESSSNI